MIFKANFVNYVLEFYGDRGIYPMGATVEQIMLATAKLISNKNYDFAGDSFDRENVRDILIADFGLKFPEQRQTKKAL